MPVARATLPLVAQTPAPTARVGTTAGLPTLRAWLLTRVSASGAVRASAIKPAARVPYPVRVARTRSGPLHQERRRLDAVAPPAPEGAATPVSWCSSTRPSPSSTVPST